eukprot:gene23557-biopygen1273
MLHAPCRGLREPLPPRQGVQQVISVPTVSRGSLQTGAMASDDRGEGHRATSLGRRRSARASRRRRARPPCRQRKGLFPWAPVPCRPSNLVEPG